MKPLTLGLVYHFNQNTVPNAFVADRVCYRRLLETLLSHPKCGFTVHFSGTLLSALQWGAHETIGLVRLGISRGQFEVLGSTFAQNILPATDAWENTQQILHHRKQIKDILDVEPAGFWNPERCWNQDIAGLILDAGYEYTFVETNVFRKAGDQHAQAVIRSTRDGDRHLVLYPDDTNLLTVLGKAIRTGSSDELIEYLYNIWLAQSQSPELDFAAIYAQDAEGTGLWQFESGEQSLDDVFSKLDTLLSKLEKLPWLRVGGLAERARSARTVCIAHLPPGQANWMVDSLRSENLPWGDPGYSDWFDYIDRSAKNIQTRELYYQVSKELRHQETVLSGLDNATPGYEASRRLHDLACRTLVAHQYEFGCIGLDVDKETQWQLARSALAVLWASRMALRQEQSTLVRKEDVNHDGLDEVTVVSGGHAYVFAPKGGRLLYWFDLRRGHQLVGNQNASCYFERYRDDNSFVGDFHGGRDVFPKLAQKPEIADLVAQRYVMRRRCLNDAIAFDGQQLVGLYNFVFEMQVSADPMQAGVEGMPVEVDGVRVSAGEIQNSAERIQVGAGGTQVGVGAQPPSLVFAFDGRRFRMRKRVVFLRDGIEVHYTLEGYPDVKQVQFRTENEITPDYFTMLDHGKQCLEAETRGAVTTVTNSRSMCKVEVSASGPESAAIRCVDEPGFLSWLCVAEIEADLADGLPLHWVLSLRST